MLPQRETLEDCFAHNNDGAGYMYYRDGGDGMVHIRKGFMTFNSFYNSLMSHNFNENDVVVMHFRIATHGKVDQGRCHPFPITRDMKFMSSTRVKCKTACAHNGILSDYGYSKKYSDTMNFVHDVLAHPILSEHIKDDNEIQSMIDNLLDGDKLVILSNDGTILKFGKWHTGKDSCLYSNQNFDTRFRYFDASSWTPTRYGNYGYGYGYGYGDDVDDWYSDYTISPSWHLESTYKNVTIKAVGDSLNMATDSKNDCPNCKKSWYDCDCDTMLIVVDDNIQSEEQYKMFISLLKENWELRKQVVSLYNRRAMGYQIAEEYKNNNLLPVVIDDKTK